MSDRTANGRFAAGNKAAAGRRDVDVEKASRAPGSDGVIAYGGYVQSGEESSKLQGRQKWVEYTNAFPFPPVAIAALLRWNLLSGAKWTLTPNKAGGADAERGVEVVQEGLLDAPLEEPWSEVVAKAGMSYFNGSSLHAFAMGRRKDGLVVFTDIAHRPMHTIERWLRPADDRPFEAVEQVTRDGKHTTIPLNRCLYVVEKMLSDDPFGVGVLRLVVERLRRANSYEVLEGSELFSGMGGTPIAEVPLEEIAAETEDMSEEQAAAHKKKLTANIETIVSDRIKTPEKRQYIVLSSATYQGGEQNAISQIKKWNIRILKGELQGLPEIRKIITDLILDVARILDVEWAFIGGGDTRGTFSAHESKLGRTAESVQTTLNRIGVRGTRQLARRLVAANGLEPDTATPTLTPPRITISDVLRVAEMLSLIAKANLHPKDPARNIMREREGLPPEPEEAIEADLMAPRARVEENDEIDDVLDDDDPDPGNVKPTENDE